MAMYGLGDATPTDPKRQFSGRYRAGLGMAYGPQRASGAPELFGNTPLEVSNRREFMTLKHDFLIAHDVDTTNVWEMQAAATLTVVADSPNGLAVMTAANANNNTVAQMQFFPGAIVAAGEVADPINQEVVCQAWCGKMPFALTTDWFIGIAEDDTTVLAATGVMGNGSYIGFHHLENATTVRLVQGDSGNAISAIPLRTLWTPADSVNTLRELAVMIVGNRKYFWFIDGICVGAAQVGDVIGGVTTAAFTDKMTPTICTKNGAEEDAAITYVDYQFLQATRLTAPLGG